LYFQALTTDMHNAANEIYLIIDILVIIHLRCGSTILYFCEFFIKAACTFFDFKSLPSTYSTASIKLQDRFVFALENLMAHNGHIR